jgi:hypothetical protein
MGLAGHVYFVEVRARVTEATSNPLQFQMGADRAGRLMADRNLLVVFVLVRCMFINKYLFYLLRLPFEGKGESPKIGVWA